MVKISNETLITNIGDDDPFAAVDSPSRSSISPPPRKKRRSRSPLVIAQLSSEASGQSIPKSSNVERFIPSPIQLNRITDLPASSNVDTVSLRDILGDPLISQCWIFNYLVDVDFVMSQLDEDVQDTVQVKVVHGSWKKEDSNKARIDAATQRYRNVQSITAYMPEAYGTHHSKMIITFRHDDLAQVNLLTGNMVAGDWRMSQAIWRSPLLPLLAPTATKQPSLPTTSASASPLGSGARFKSDLLAYLRGYNRLGSLVDKLSLYDFRAVRGALVASLPHKQTVARSDKAENLWGLPGLARVLRSIPNYQDSTQEGGVASSKVHTSSFAQNGSSVQSSKPQIVIQISSVASIGEKWLREYCFPQMSFLYSTPTTITSPQFSIVFPTADEIRRSIEGYGSGGSIHMRTQSAAQQKQLDLIHPMLCHWAGDERPAFNSDMSLREAGRRRAAPHIKTYIRFNNTSMTKIDWAMMTSANLSNQAWGSTTKDGQVRVCSYEIGIVVWPGLWDDNETNTKAEMVPVFKKNTPDDLNGIGDEAFGIRVGWRMPYDLPLLPYNENQEPWCATEPCAEPDWMGRSWPGF